MEATAARQLIRSGIMRMPLHHVSFQCQSSVGVAFLVSNVCWRSSLGKGKGRGTCLEIALDFADANGFAYPKGPLRTQSAKPGLRSFVLFWDYFEYLFAFFCKQARWFESNSTYATWSPNSTKMEGGRIASCAGNFGRSTRR